MCDCVTLIFGLGQVIMGAGIAVWAVFKTKKDSAALQNETIKLQMQQQKRALVYNAFRDFRTTREMIDKEFGSKFNDARYKSEGLLVANLYFPRLRSAIFSFMDSLFLFGSKDVMIICQNIGQEVNNLNSEYFTMTQKAFSIEPKTAIGDEEYEKWAEVCIEGISDKIEKLKSVYYKYETDLILAVKKDMGIEFK